MSVTIIIPARYQSVRLPGKPLLDKTGKPLIQHVVENAVQANVANDVVVATDNEKILAAVEAFGGSAIMTRSDHSSGTDRLAEAAEKLQLQDDDIVVNIQGDEPDIRPDLLLKLIELITETHAPMATLCTPLNADEADNPNRVKVAIAGNRALYFSRSKIPFDRDGGGCQYYLHLGIYAYRTGFLHKFASMKSTPLERTEKLEQLRVLEHGFQIGIEVVQYDGIGIDTPEDYKTFVGRFVP